MKHSHNIWVQAIYLLMVGGPLLYADAPKEVAKEFKDCLTNSAKCEETVKVDDPKHELKMIRRAYFNDDKSPLSFLKRLFEFKAYPSKVDGLKSARFLTVEEVQQIAEKAGLDEERTKTRTEDQKACIDEQWIRENSVRYCYYTITVKVRSVNIAVGAYFKISDKQKDNGMVTLDNNVNISSVKKYISAANHKIFLIQYDDKDHPGHFAKDEIYLKTASTKDPKTENDTENLKRKLENVLNMFWNHLRNKDAK